jgi:hypothetical protein
MTQDNEDSIDFEAYAAQLTAQGAAITADELKGQLERLQAGLWTIAEWYSDIARRFAAYLSAFQPVLAAAALNGPPKGRPSAKHVPRPAWMGKRNHNGRMKKTYVYWTHAKEGGRL